MQATNLIGHGVLVDGSNVTCRAARRSWAWSWAATSTACRSSSATRTARKSRPWTWARRKAGVIPLAWDGVPDATKVDSDGKPVTLADGNYTFRSSPPRAATRLNDAKACPSTAWPAVTTNSADGVKLNLPSKGAVTLADIKQVL
jgi:flagellar basal-body rod modification protein FlgD